MRPGPRAPLAAIYRPQLALGIGPLVTNRYAMLVEISNVGFASQKPQQFVFDRLEMHLLRCNKREARGQIETHLVPKDAARAGAGAVALGDAFIENPLHQVEILSHARIVSREL